MPQQPVTFFSKYGGYQIIMVHDTKVVVGDEVVKKPHRILKFSHGQLTTSDEAVIAFLRGNKNYGRDFYASDDVEAAPAVAPATAAAQGPLEVTKPRTKKGQKATVNRAATTAADVDAEAA